MVSKCLSLENGADRKSELNEQSNREYMINLFLI